MSVTAGAPRRRQGPPPIDPKRAHLDWLSLIEVSGPFLTLPVLMRAWPTLDGLEKPIRDELRARHGQWQQDQSAGQHAWVDFVLRDLLEWGDALETDPARLAALALAVPDHDTTLRPDFTLDNPSGGAGKPALLGMTLPPGAQPTARLAGSSWSATPADRMAQLCRHHDVQLGLVTDGRWWALVWAPRDKVTTVAVFDAIGWPELAERGMVRALRSMLRRSRFFAVPDDELLTALLDESTRTQEDVTEALGTQVRRAVELLVDAIGRADATVDAADAYRGAVTVMMRVVFLLFAEERGLLPADNEIYASAYSAGRLYEQLKKQADEAGESALRYSTAAWHRLLALFTAVYQGVEHPALRMPAYGGSLFDPSRHQWLTGGLAIDDQTVLHMLDSVQNVTIGAGKHKEHRRLSFRALDVEQIGYVYEGLLSFDGERAIDAVLGLTGKAGREEEVPLGELEKLAKPYVTGHQVVDPAGLAAVLAEVYKESGVGSVKALERRLTPPDEAERERRLGRLRSATGGDQELAERVLPFVELVRLDLRGLPVVILPGTIYVTESRLRKNTGTHYTPRELAEQVVEGALKPLLYHVGPLQTADESQWTRRGSAELLSLKVADIAVGSAAFLVAACRYLATALVDAWSREGDEHAVAFLARDGASGGVADAEADPVMIEARRQIIEHCLYGADINPAAVEMAKLSLWLVSMDGRRPFTFLDDRLIAGDSLHGITSLEQVEWMHLDPKLGRELHDDTMVDYTSGIRPLVRAAMADRRKIAAIGGDSLAHLAEKRELLAEAREETEQVALYADLVVGAGLAACVKGSARVGGDRNTFQQAAYAAGLPADEARAQADQWLDLDRPPAAFPRVPIHWPLAFPEVVDQDGFDAIIGNPPFLGGQKLTGSLGTVYREYLVSYLGHGVRGSADLVAYMLLRAHELLNPAGQAGLIATNTLAQGDTREVGLDQVVADGATIRASVKSEKWPSKSAVLEYCAVWTSRSELGAGVRCIADDIPVSLISPSLDPASQHSLKPERLAVNSAMSFIGSYVLGMGFTMSPEEAHRLTAKNARNEDVLFPYLNGQDLNSRPDGSASRWVINFHDWSEAEAARYPECFAQVHRLVKPEREKVKRAVRRERWWQFAERSAGLYSAIAGLGRVIVITLVSKVVMPVMVPTGQVFSHALGVFASDDAAMLALLSSAPHYWWAIDRASTMKGDLRYTPTDVFETLVRPELTGELRVLGERLDTFRRGLMLGRDAGLTATYNLVHEERCQDADIRELRAIHQAIDEATVRAYGWNDLLSQGLDHGHHDTRQGVRYTIGPAVRVEILDRLRELNHQVYEQEKAAGLHDKGAKKPKKAAKPRQPKPPAIEGQGTML